MKSLLAVVLFALLFVAGARAESQVLVLDPARSKVDIAVKATVDSFVGKLSAYQADIAVDPAAARVTSCRFAFKFADIKTGKDDRDKKMNEWQDSAKNPDGLFVMEKLEPAADGKVTVTGKLSIHGVEKTLVFPATVTEKAGEYTLSGEATVVTTEHGLPVIRMMGFLKVDPKVVVRFVLVGAAKAAK